MVNEATNAPRGREGEGRGGGGGVNVNIHALGRDPPCPCHTHTATRKRYLLKQELLQLAPLAFVINGTLCESAQSKPACVQRTPRRIPFLYRKNPIYVDTLLLVGARGKKIIPLKYGWLS